jgi:hypothetical protein
MTKRPLVRIHNTETNEVIDREMNDAEFAAYEANQAANAAKKAQEEAEAAALSAAKQAAQDKLKALGLNDLEIAAITGA